MADSPNVSVVRRLYQARGNPDVIRQVLARGIRWEVVEGFPYGAVYVGLDSVLHDFFGRLFTAFDEFVADGAEFFEIKIGISCFYRLERPFDIFDSLGKGSLPLRPL